MTPPMMSPTVTAAGRLEGKVAVVTGGADGIGLVIAELFAANGASVAILDVRATEGRRAADALAERGHDAMFVESDVAVEESVAQAMSLVWQRWGALHVLVNNAAISGPEQPTDDVDYDQWKALFAVNVGGPFLCTKHAIAYMRRTTGDRSIIDMSSIYGLVGNTDSPSYHATKGAVRLMAKTDAMTYAPEGIRVNAVCPGTIMTPLNARKCGQDPQYLDAMRALHPLGRVGEPEDVAYGVLYLASDEARFVTGTELVIDGGYTAQ